MPPPSPPRQRDQRILPNALWALSHRSVAGLSLLLAHVLFARVLLPAEVGRYHLAVFLGMLAATAATHGLPSSATRFIAAERGRGGGAAAALERHLARAAAAGFVLVAALAAFAATLLPASVRPASLVAMIAFGAAHSLRLLAAGIAQGRADFSGQARASLAAALVLPVGALWIVWRGGDASTALWITAAHAALLGALMLRPNQRVPSREPLPPSVVPALRRYCAAVSVLLLLDTVVWRQSEAVFLALFREPHELGHYTVAYQLVAQAMQLLPGSLGVVFFPALAHLASSGGPGELAAATARFTRQLAAAALPVGALGALLAPQILTVLFGSEYTAAAPAARLLWLGGALGATAVGTSAALYATDRLRPLILLGAALAAINIGLDLVLIPPSGVWGAAMANSTVQAAGALGSGVLAARLIGPLPWASLARITASAGLATLVAFGVQSALDGWWALGASGGLYAASYLGLLALLRELPWARGAASQRLGGGPAPEGREGR